MAEKKAEAPAEGDDAAPKSKKKLIMFIVIGVVVLVLIIGGAGYLYGGLIGAIIFKFMQDYLSALTPQYWPFWIGLVLVTIVLVGRDRISSWTAPIRRLSTLMNSRAFGSRRDMSSIQRTSQ